MESGSFVADDWSSPPVLVAHTFGQRWKGLKPRSLGIGMLIRGGSVHGFGMKEPLLVVGLDPERRVVGWETLLPGRFIRIGTAVEILELPAGAQPPPEGAVLTWVGAGPADRLRNPHRQSR